MKLDKLYGRYAPIIADFERFVACIKRPLVQSLRLNTLKARRDSILSFLKDVKLKQLPFYSDGFSVEGRQSLGNHITHNLGLIYVQEVASMIPVVLLDPRPGEVIMDLCAAPGSKTTQIAQLMTNKGLLVANEINRKRMRGLIHNIKRCGLLNEVVISINGQKAYRIFEDYFDRVLLDAPCSAEGTIRKSKAVLYHWGTKNIYRMSRLQIGLALSAFRCLRTGGIMVYSTCTIAPEENELVVSYLLEKFPEAELLPVTLSGFKVRPGITRWQGVSYDRRIEQCARILPQDNDTAPFFVARLTKRGVVRPRVDYLGKIEVDQSLLDGFTRKFGGNSNDFEPHAVFRTGEGNFISTPEVFSFREVKSLRKGLEFGKVYNHEVKPDNDMVQIFGSYSTKNIVELKEWQVKKFLRGEILKVGHLTGIDHGFVIIQFKNMPIGTGKYNGSEIRSTIKRERRTP